MHYEEALVRVEGLTKHFPIRDSGLLMRQTGVLQAVDDVSFEIRRGETLGLVGESGCGKSTLGRTILQLYKATSGKVYFQGTELTALRDEPLRLMRQRMQIIFQDPYSSLNPRMKVGKIIGEPLVIHDIGSRKERVERVRELVEIVGLSGEVVSRFPHEFSGGQRQRIGVARALAPRPQFIVCDEPISSLDVSIQAQIVNLLKELQEQFDLTFLFIAHDLSMVRYISDRVMVMYLGKIVELALRDDLYEQPLHPYTQALLSAIPIPDPIKERQRKQVVLEGDVPSPATPPSGCRFHTRCPFAEPVCWEEVPVWRELTQDHWISCHLAERWVDQPVSDAFVAGS